jgi:asparagine synthase (glutamine-hydrolysing)
MCGFFGLVDFRSQITLQDQKEISERVVAIRHRGPDDSGSLVKDNICLYFNRLSIIDLAAPSQPYCNEDKSVFMVCNGEIYNYKELKEVLRAKGHVFVTQTDSEIIVHGYEEWGTALWTKLNGIFAIVIWDSLAKRIFLVRDHLGVKPLHYMLVKNGVYFGSDYSSFLGLSREKVELNNSAVLSYLSFRYVIGEQTFYRNIKDVLPSHSIAIDQKESRDYCYWDIPTETDEEDLGEEHYLSTLEDKLSLAIKRQLMSDVPVGAFISGGLDSSILLYYIHQGRKDIKTFITGFSEEGYNEFVYADLMAQSLEIVPQKIILELSEYMSNMDEAISFRGEPISVPHEAAFLKMSRFMKEHITVVLSGEGADELFGGYGRIFRSPFDYYKQRRINTLPVGSHLAGKIFNCSLEKIFPSPYEHFLCRYSWFNEEDKKNFINMEYFDNQLIDEYSLAYMHSLFDRVKSSSYYRAMYYIQGKIHLVNLLNRLDRMTMAASIEARVPFLDYELVEFVSRMPIYYKLRWNSMFSRIRALFLDSERISERFDTPKFILKLLASGKIPDKIINRKKMGFPVPLDCWFNDRFKERAREILLDTGAKINEFINIKNLSKFLSQETFSSKYDYDGKKIWMLINLELWMRKTFH